MIIGTMLAAGIVMLVVVIARRHAVNVDELGSLSDHWVAAHRTDSP